MDASKAMECAAGAVGIPGECVAEWMENIDARGNTKAEYANALRYYAAFLGSTGRDGSRPADVLAYKEELLGAGYSARTVSSYLTGVRSFYRYMAEAHGAADPAKGVKGARAPKGFAKDPLDAAQCVAVLEGMPRDSEAGLRDYAMINLLIRTGLRTIEVVRADVADLRACGASAVLYVQGKGHDSKDDFVVLNAATLGPILEYLEARGDVADSDPLFCSVSRRNEGGRLTTASVSRIAKEAMRAAGIDSERITAHSLRHTAVTLALEGGASIQEVQAMARHADIGTTMIYAHNIERAAGVPEDAIGRMLEAAR